MELVNTHHFLPDQKPGVWQPGTPIECLPALKLQFPGTVDEGLLSMQLVNPAWPRSTEWHFRLIDTEGERTVPVTLFADAYGDSYDYSDWEPDDFPSGLLNDLRKTTRLQALQDTLAVFKPASFDVLKRITSEATETAELVEQSVAKGRIRQLARQADFFRTIAMELATHLSQQADLLNTTVKRLKRMAPEGGAEDSLWAELGAQTYEQSLPDHEVLSGAGRQVYKTFKQLSSAERLALSFCAAADQDFPGGDERETWDPPPGPRKDWKEWRVNDLCEDIGRTILGLADENHWRQVEDSD